MDDQIHEVRRRLTKTIEELRIDGFGSDVILYEFLMGARCIEDSIRRSIMKQSEQEPDRILVGGSIDNYIDSIKRAVFGK